jgi:uncharacterized protein (TIGR03435 family)
MATNLSMASPPVTEEISWSRSASAHLALLQQSVPSEVAANHTAAAGPLKFEVASIRAPIYPRSARFACRGIDGTIEPYLGIFPSAFGEVSYKGQVGEGPMSVPNGRCIGQPDVIHVISIAYGIPTFDISGGPAWVWALGGSDPIQRFNIEAKAEDVSSVTKDQLRQMLRSMLADRFKFKFHWETKESQGFALRVGKNGPKLKETSEEEEYPHPVYTPLPAYPLPATIIIKGKSSLRSLADFLAQLAASGRPVVDKTGLTGTYDYTLTWHQFPSTGQRGASGGDGGSDPLVFTALEQQLGLRLEPMKVQSQAIVIDEVKKPSEN